MYMFYVHVYFVFNDFLFIFHVNHVSGLSELSDLNCEVPELLRPIPNLLLREDQAGGSGKARS